ncbi:MAG: hypothetical protein CO096_06810 [Armatimonadetes bacterium CG_4_9_14_3_um_filter_66_14]|nr:MAG: hypothetical protein COZ57_22945 [Armatimonadetes bacterium CG_4_8_14_3_um_filter_66_20]PJB72947.1 MAG: hypothetical protein CO096_06810 [Armatimonadetes bacterium CG_4_9_14_3_um_filter_66_14]
MSSALRTIEDYEFFLYTLAEQFPSIRRSTLRLIHRGQTLARVTGELRFDGEVRLVVRERLLYDRLPVRIDEYGYEVWLGDDELCWYDPQPHPDDPTLQSTHPHHKHVAPDLKHNRVPAEGMSFTRPNLPSVIGEVEGLLRQC